ncbi:MAG: transcriptional repressor [Verrucomicrobia bacterium]|nr:transcriptional repressor [Verrucomicrobiota bacterium]
MHSFDPDSILISHGIRPSRQRRAILKYIAEHPSHPTAEDVYQALYKTIKTLSRTTVYNTLRLFCSKGAAQMVTLEENEMRFDAATHPHGHFKCTECGKIFDFPYDTMFDDASGKLPEGFRLEETQLYVRGICKECNEAKSGMSACA